MHTETHTHRLAHMCKGEERESAKESQESHLRAYVPWISRAVKSIVYPYYTGHWLPLCFGLIRRSGTNMCLCVCVYGSSLLLFVPYGLGLPVFTCYQTCSYLFNIDDFFEIPYVHFFANFSIHWVVSKWRWLVCHVSSFYFVAVCGVIEYKYV